MSFSDTISNAWKISILDEGTTQAVSKDPTGFKNGVLFLIVTGIIMGLGAFFVSAIAGLGAAGFIQVITYPIMMLIGFFIWGLIIHLFAKLFKGTGSLTQWYAGASHTYLFYWIAIIPFVGQILVGLAGLWNIVLQIHVAKHVHGFSTGKAVVVVLLPIVIIGILAVALAGVFVATMFSGLGV